MCTIPNVGGCLQRCYRSDRYYYTALWVCSFPVSLYFLLHFSKFSSFIGPRFNYITSSSKLGLVIFGGLCKNGIKLTISFSPKLILWTQCTSLNQWESSRMDQFYYRSCRTWPLPPQGILHPWDILGGPTSTPTHHSATWLSNIIGHVNMTNPVSYEQYLHQVPKQSQH